MNRLPVILMFVALSALVLYAASPAGTVSSPGPFTLRGVSVPVNGVPNWPFFKGDKVESRETPVTVTFRDNSSAVLAPDSAVKVDAEDGTTVLRLVRGDMTVIAAPNTRVQFYSGPTPVAVREGQPTAVSAKITPQLAMRPVPKPPPPNVPPAVSNR